MDRFTFLRILGFFLINFLTVGIVNSQTANLKVYVNDTIQINSEIFGINNDWKQITNTAFPGFNNTFDNYNYTLLRFPGGWESEYYDWSTNTTPSWNNTPTNPGASISTIKSNVGNYSIVVPTRLAMDVTYPSTAWNEAIDSLKKIAKEAIDLADPAKINYVEIGNEWWLQYAGGATRADKLQKYSKTAVEIVGYIHTQYPNRNFNILVNGDFTEPDEFTTMKNYFTENYDAVDGLALHTYTGYSTTTHNINKLAANIDACASNFNSTKHMVIYASEWMASRDYNDHKLYMEAANILPDIFHIYARKGIEAAAYWPPVNSSAPGVGITNWNGGVVYPCGQIMGDMSASYTGQVVRTVNDGITITGALQNKNNLVLYVMGHDSTTKNVNIDITSFNVSSVNKVTKFRPNDYSTTNKAAAYTEESSSVNIVSTREISFDINSAGKYEIYKIELNGVVTQEESSPGVDFETPITPTPLFGATFQTVANPDNNGLNKSATCGKSSRSSSNWYELVDVPIDFSIPKEEKLYAHIMVKYDVKPDIVLRINNESTGLNRAINEYTEIGKWQDLVFELNGSVTTTDVTNIRFMHDCGDTPSNNYILNNTNSFALFDEIIINNSPTPRSISTSLNNNSVEVSQAQLIAYNLNGSIFVDLFGDEDKMIEIYNTSGALVKKEFTKQLVYTPNIPGLYIVKCNNDVKKVIIK